MALDSAHDPVVDRTRDAPTTSSAGPVPSASTFRAIRHGTRRIVDRLSAGDGTFDRPPSSDVLLAVGLFLPPALIYALDPGEPTGGLSTPWVGWPLMVLLFAPLAWRRVAPTLTITVTGLTTAAWFALTPALGSGVNTAVPLAVMVALYSVSAYGSRSDGIVSMIVTQFFVTLSFLRVMAQDDAVSAYNLVANVLIFLGIWALGDRTRVRRELVDQLRARALQAERSHELATELAVADERTRIARELHDVVAHTVSVVVVQAGAGRRVAETDPQGAGQALASIEAVGRDALTDLRRMVGMLRGDTISTEVGPQPTLADLPELTERLAAAGLPVTLREEGAAGPAQAGVELSAYRIVQEALTNVLKHAGAVRNVEVVVERGADALSVSVIDDGRGAASDTDLHDGAGSGLLGMRERAGLFGGHLEAGSRLGGGFAVRAVLPVPSDDRSDDPPSKAKA